jgi:hypothetical protein
MIVDTRQTPTRHRSALARAGARTVLSAATLLLLLALCGVAGAAAATPGWRMTVDRSPTNLPPGGTGLLVLHPRNIGTADTNGSTVTVTDTLPPGLEATQAGELIDAQEHTIGNSRWDCAGVKVVTCTNDPIGQPTLGAGPGNGLKSLHEVEQEATENANLGLPDSHSAPEIAIAVKVIGAGTNGAEPNTTRVFGGGAPYPSVLTQAITISASAPPFGVSSFNTAAFNEDGSASVQAGAHPYKLEVGLSLNNELSPDGSTEFAAGGDAKNIHVELPVGFVGDPQAVPQCSREEFDAPQIAGGAPLCPAGSQVGVVQVNTANSGAAPLPLSLPIYNLVPPPGEPAQFGFQSLGIYGTLDAALRTGGDYGLTANVDNTAQRSLVGTTVTLWGVPAASSHDRERFCLNEAKTVGRNGCASGVAPRPFLSNPTECGSALSWTASVNSWLDPEGGPSPVTALASDNLGNSIAIGGCERLDYSPTVSVAPDTTVADSPSGLHVDVHVPQTYGEPEGLAEANVRNVVVALPPGMSLSPSAANGLSACSEAQIGLNNNAQPSCPDASKVGSVEVSTPLLADPLRGSVYLAAQNENPFHSLLAVYIVAQADGALVKLAGHVEADPVTGQLTTTVENAPQLPFEDFKLDFFGGPRAPLATPATCGSFSSSGSTTPYSSTTPVSFLEAFPISSGCGGGFAPQFNAGSTSPLANASTNFTTTFSRADGEQNIDAITLNTPPGLLGMLSKVPLCPEFQAASGTCGAASQIGVARVAAGPGPDPYWLAGAIYLTGPYKGAPFGLSIVVPVVAGPFNLGDVSVRATIRVDPTDAHLTVTTDPLPQVVQGIPTRIRIVNAEINRPGFMFNPSDCGPKQVTGQAISVAGASAPVANPFSITECARLAFKPKLSASTSAASTKRGTGANLDVKIALKAGEANLRYVKVELPKQLPVSLKALNKACTEQVFDVNPAGCPAASIVGTAIAKTPILPVPLSGPVYLVSHGGAAFPDQVLVLQGDGVLIVQRATTFVSKTGILSATFANVPDAPLESIDVSFPKGPLSLLVANGNVCSSSLALRTTLEGHNGSKLTGSEKIAVIGCKKPKPSVRVVAHKLQRASQLVLTLKTNAKGALRISGTGVTTFTRKGFASGRHAVTVTLNAAGRRASSRHTTIKLKATLTVGKQKGAGSFSVKL